MSSREFLSQWITLSFVSDQVKNSLLAQQSLCLMTIERWSHSFPFRTGQWNTLSPMIVGCISSESRTSSGSPFQNPGFERSRGFCYLWKGCFSCSSFLIFFQLAEKTDLTKWIFFCKIHDLAFTKAKLFKNQNQRTDKCEHRQFQEWLSKALKKTYEVRALKEKPKDEG